MKRNGFLELVVDNPKIVLLLVGILVAFGIYGLGQMNKQEFPEFTIRQGLVAAVYPGASTEEVDHQVTKPIEDYLYTFVEVDKEKTYSYTKEGVVYVYVELDNSVNNQTEVWSKIRHGLKDFKAKLPAGVLAVVVVDDFGNTSSLLITMDSKDKTYREMEGYMSLLKKRLRSVEAVGNIKSFGEQKEEISVYVDREKLANYGISQQTLSAVLFSQGFLTVGGTVSDEEEELPLHVQSPYKSEYELSEQVIFTAPTGQTIRLKDVALIERRYETPTSYITKDGNQALVLSVEMRSGNNIVKFGEEVDKVLKDFQRTLPDGVSLYRITDLPQVVDDSIWSFFKDLLTAMLVVIAVMLLLFPLQSALIPAIEIPLTTAVTFSVMYIIGYEMNIVTLASLIVTLGMMVDDSIVMVDGYMDNIRHGQQPREAAIQSAKTFFPSLVVATLSISAIFFPYLFTMHGPLADFVKFFPTTITISLTISLALAMLLTPWLETKMLKNRTMPSRRGFAKVQNHFFETLEGGYEQLLQQCFRHPKVTIAAGVANVLLAVVLFLVMPLQLMPKAERDSFAVEIYLPTSSTLEQTGEVCSRFQEVLEADPDIKTVTTFVGSSSPRFMAAYSPKMPAKNFAQMIVKTANPKTTERVVERYKDSYIDSMANATIRIKQLDYQAVANPIEVRLRGEDVAELMQYADTLKRHLTEIDDLVWVHSDMEGYQPTVKIELKPDEASRLGVTKALLSSNLAMLYGGVPLTTVWEDDYGVAVKLYTSEESDSVSLPDIASTLVPTSVPGVWVPLSQVATVTPDWQPSQIAHRNGMPCVTVGADLRFGKSQPKTMKKVKAYVNNDFKEILPDDIELTYGGLDAVNDDTIGDIAIGLVASVLIVFFFLLFNFKKIRLTLLSLCGTLLCLLGAFLGLAIFHCDISLTAIIGIVSLIGINVRNNIVMFDYAEQLRTEGRSVREAAFEAGRRRMRPIFLTSTTTAVGVIPMIIHRSALWMPMGIVICFGILFAIVFIVTVMPVAYWKLFDNKFSNNR
ncbi:MAG: efflux RND transporter permease subunit [Bacteroidales bacterium]|nr:efflux RND transporter permease subunit [Bacteroidales bacterium]